MWVNIYIGIVQRHGDVRILSWCHVILVCKLLSITMICWCSDITDIVFEKYLYGGDGAGDSDFTQQMCQIPHYRNVLLYQNPHPDQVSLLFIESSSNVWYVKSPTPICMYCQCQKPSPWVNILSQNTHPSNMSKTRLVRKFLYFDNFYFDIYLCTYFM